MDIKTSYCIVGWVMFVVGYLYGGEFFPSRRLMLGYSKIRSAFLELSLCVCYVGMCRWVNHGSIWIIQI